MSTTTDSLGAASARTTLRYAANRLKPFRGAFAGVIALQGAAALCAALIPAIIGRAIDAITGDGLSTGGAMTYAGGIAGAALVAALLTWAAMLLATATSERALQVLRDDFMRAVTSLPLSFTERVGTGPLTSRGIRDVDTLTWCLRFGVPRFTIALITAVMYAVVAFVAGGVLALTLIVGIAIMWWPFRAYLRRAPLGYTREGRRYDGLNSHVTQTCDSVRTIEAMNVGRARRIGVDAQLRRAFLAERYNMGMRNAIIPAQQAGPLVSLVLVVALGAWLIQRDAVSVGQVVSVSLYMLRITDPINMVSRTIDEVQMALTSLTRLVAVTQVPSDRRVTGREPSGSTIVLRDVGFSYRPGHPVLEGVNLEVSAGERLVIVGPSGAGKSTLGRIISGVNPPTTGRAEVGGVSICELSSAQLHREVCLLTQEYHVFVGTIADNLRLATPDATDAQLMAALATVAADGWVAELADGLQTVVGQGGHELDPASAQQLALARVALADPHTIILDEATSMLDPRAARNLEQALNTLLAGRTVIAIAHRLSTATDADRILIVDGGKIVEQGTHTELLAAGGSYAKLWATWQAE